MKDIKKLPVWAQDEIKTLKYRLEQMEKRATAWEEGRVTMVSIPHMNFDPNDKPKYLPDDRKIRFKTGLADWQWVDVKLRKTSEDDSEVFLELMAGTDMLIAPEVRNVLRIFVGR